jgi:hypothetical protein
MLHRVHAGAIDLRAHVLCLSFDSCVHKQLFESWLNAASFWPEANLRTPNYHKKNELALLQLLHA